MARKQNSGSAGTPRGTGKKHSVWDACRKARDAAAARQAQADANLQSAALTFGGFSLNAEGDRWVTHCPHCGGKVELYSVDSGVEVVGYSPRCDAVSRFRQWLRKAGFRS